MATGLIEHEEVSGLTTVPTFAVKLKAGDLIVRITIAENTGIHFPSEYIVEDVIVNAGHVFLSIRAGGSTYTEPFTMAVPRDAIVAVTI